MTGKSARERYDKLRGVRRFSDVHPARRGVVFAWFAFTLTFGLLRLLTWAIHVHLGNLGDVSAGSVHLHHYIWGILIVLAVACFGLTERNDRHHAWMGTALGIGTALIADEIALLINLRDVYWTSQGGISVGVAVILIGVVGGALALTHPDPD